MPTPLHAEFVMHGARAAMADGLVHIEEQVKGIERAIAENPGLAFDLARTLVESACRTILTERKHAFESGDDLPKLFKTVTMCLPVLPAAASAEATAQKSLKQTLNGLHTALQGVCELRNSCGFASHGADGPRPAMEAVQALLAAQAADAIVGFLHRIHRQDQSRPTVVALRYEDNETFNDFVDDEHGEVMILEFKYRPSEVLFRVDLEAYRDALAGYEPAVAEEQGASSPSPAPGGNG